MSKEKLQILPVGMFPNIPTGVMIDYGDGVRRPVFIPIGYGKLDEDANKWQRRQKYGQCIPPNDEADRVRAEIAQRHPHKRSLRSGLGQSMLPERGAGKPTSIPHREVLDDGFSFD